jgi:hypothetical protein
VSPMNVVNSTASRVLPRIGPSGGREELKDPVVGDVRFSPLLHRPSLREDAFISLTQTGARKHR